MLRTACRLGFSQLLFSWRNLTTAQLGLNFLYGGERKTEICIFKNTIQGLAFFLFLCYDSEKETPYARGDIAMITVENGRPKTDEGRTKLELSVYRKLDELEISYQRADHVPAMTMDDCVAIGKALDAPVCKNLFLCNRQMTAFYLLLMPGNKPFKTKELSAQIGAARLSFASPEYMEKYLHTTPGSASVLGLLFDHERSVKLLIDEDVLVHPMIGAHPCINTSTLAFKTEDLLERILRHTGHTPQTVKL